MGNTGIKAPREPWNKGKSVGPKAPFKLKDISLGTSSTGALSGGSSRAIALLLSSCPYRATDLPPHPLHARFYRGDNYPDTGGLLLGSHNVA